MSNKSNKIINKFKYIIGLDDFEEEVVEEPIDPFVEEELPVKKRVNNRIVSIHTNLSMKLTIHEPRRYEDAPKIVEDIKNRKTVVINLEHMDGDSKRQIFDFLNGAIYALEGVIQKVAKDIFILAPNNVEINGNIKEQLKNKGIFPWQK
ncbi:cell division protein SepF [Caloranaerobacter azorensis]|uniref:Cell division protein SepF n=2 Tax=Caloranaerobacter azorensis TaxID=116090 RepID=A0A096BFT5_9FIRM|nr:cell division protein SepF [Caloranaerobacter azorensis]KGG79563.1 cell division protein SepF [Caloranaerobacter azorensis H53214]QIB26670.1 cell division protein SepF [Caloranaerobacter azorensis]